MLHLLSLVFLDEPSDDFLRTIKDADLFDQWPLPQAPPQIESGMKQIRLFLGRHDSAEEIKADFTRLFLGPGRIPAPPYESVFRSEEHLMFEKEMLDVRKVYRGYSMGIQNKNSVPDDHAGFELQFAALLCLKIAESLKKNNLDDAAVIQNDLLRFMDAHLLKWLPDFFSRVKDSSSTGYFRGMADFAHGVIRSLRHACSEPHL